MSLVVLRVRMVVMRSYGHEVLLLTGRRAPRARHRHTIVRHDLVVLLGCQWFISIHDNGLKQGNKVFVGRILS